ncbi:MAG: hypothetical protein AAGI52_04120 [Bacteroidota bacterium]
MTETTARHSLYLALGTAGVVPGALLVVGLAGVLKTLGFAIPSFIGGLVGSILLLALGGSVILVPVALASLGSYRRQTAPTRQRTMWTVVVLALLSPLACALVILLWQWVAG